MTEHHGSVLWAFRVASRPGAGGGHVARCLSLARALNGLGDRVLFVVDDDGLRWQRSILEEGHGCVTASSTLREPIAHCVIDGYDFDTGTIETWRQQAGVMVAIVDHQPPPDWADLTIAPSLSPAASGHPEQLTSGVLAGLSYALVAARFVEPSPRNIRETVGNVLVSFGQRDSRNATGLALRAMGLLPERIDSPLTITVALGGSALHIPEVERHVKEFDGAAFEIDADMTACYAAADFVIGGGGVSLLDRMAGGIPSVSIILADNQREQIARCAEVGGTLDAGRFEDIDPARLARTVASLMHSRTKRATMSANARHAVDGLGAQRCAQAMWNCARTAPADRLR